MQTFHHNLYFGGWIYHPRQRTRDNMLNEMKIISVVGARPNFMKIAPFIRAIEKHNARSEEIEHILQGIITVSDIVQAWKKQAN